MEDKLLGAEQHNNKKNDQVQKQKQNPVQKKIGPNKKTLLSCRKLTCWAGLVGRAPVTRLRQEEARKKA